MNETIFWQCLDELVASHELIIDRPKGSAHPRYPDFNYPYDYGYLKGTQSMDQGGIDVWCGSQPERMLTAVILTVDRVKNDTEMKLLLGCTSEEIQAILNLHNSGSQAGILIRRSETGKPIDH